MPVLVLKSERIEANLSLEAISKIQSGYQNCHIGVWKFVIEKEFQKLHMTLSLPHGVKSLLIFILRPTVSEIWAYFQNCLSGIAYGPSFTPGVWNWSAGIGFWDTGLFLKLPYLGMKSGNLKKLDKLHMDLSFYPSGSKLSLFSIEGRQFPS